MSVTDRRLDAGGWRSNFWDLSPEQRADILAIIAREGLDDRRVMAVEYDVIDIPLLRFDVAVIDASGNALLECELEGGRHNGSCDCGGWLALRTVERPAPELPAWWRP